MSGDRSHRRRSVLFMQGEYHAATQDSGEQEKGCHVIELVCRAGEYLCAQYYETGQRQACMHEAKTRRALVLMHAKEDQVKTDSYSSDEKEE